MRSLTGTHEQFLIGGGLRRTGVHITQHPAPNIRHPTSAALYGASLAQRQATQS
jgi:hypothetical protein